MPAVPPAAVLAALLVLIGTQVAALIAPRRPPYPVRLALSAGAVAAGEFLGVLGGSRLAVGELHPVFDGVLLSAVQWGATWWWSQRDRMA